MFIFLFIYNAGDMYIYMFYNPIPSAFLAYIPSSGMIITAKGNFLPWFGKNFIFSNITIATS